MSRLVFSILVLACCVSSADEIKLSPRHVAVTGTAVAKVQPDTVVWHVNIRRENKELAKAMSEADELVKRVLALRGELKLKPEDVQTGYLSAQKIFDRDQSGNQTSFRHFQVNRSITVRQRDTSRFDEILARLVALSEVEVSYSLESSEYHAIRTKTRLEAVSAARKKATEMTELLGAKVGRPLRIAEPQESFTSHLGVSNMAFGVGRQVEADAAPGTFAPGAIEVKVTIEVAFEIE